MKILAVTQNSFQPRFCINNNLSTNFSTIRIASAQGVDTVSFGRAAKDAEPMRRLFKYGMIDIHSGKPVIDPEWFTKVLQNGFFERTIQSIVKGITPYEDCLQKVEAELFNEIKQFARTNPTYKLDDVIQKLAPRAQIKLLTMQRPIFEELRSKSHLLPEEQKKAFDELMNKTEKQLNNKPIIYKFSKKEFKYKLERINEGIKNRGISAEISTMQIIPTTSHTPIDFKLFFIYFFRI